MLWQNSKTQLTIIPKEAPAIEEIIGPSIIFEVKITNDHVREVERKLTDTPQ